MTEVPFPEITTRRLILRQITSSDSSSVLTGLSDPRVYETCGVSYQSMDEVQLQMEWYDQLYLNGTGIWWAICDPSCRSQLLGVCGFSYHQPAHRRAEIGYWLLHEHWGKGIATESVAAIVEYGFQCMGLHRIGAEVDVHNLSSTKLLERTGFQFEGLRRGCEFKNGVFIDLKCYSKLATDPV